MLGKTLIAGFGAGQAKVSAVPFAQMKAFLEASPIDVMHMLDPNLWLAAHIRAQLSPRWFPITGVTHSLGNQHFIEWALLNNANGVRADDCLVCSTPTARSVIQSVFARLGEPPHSPCRSCHSPSVCRCHSPVAADSPRNSPWIRNLRGAVAGRFNPQFKMDLRPLRLASLMGSG
jgi:hypothetical protein